MIVGQDLKGNVLIIDDVISAGTSVRESVKIIEDNCAPSCRSNHPRPPGERIRVQKLQ